MWDFLYVSVHSCCVVCMCIIGYCFLLFQDEMSVQALTDACIVEGGKMYWCVTSPTMKDKLVGVFITRCFHTYPELPRFLEIWMSQDNLQNVRESQGGRKKVGGKVDISLVFIIRLLRKLTIFNFFFVLSGKVWYFFTYCVVSTRF